MATTARSMTDRRPVHLAVLVGASAGVYAISLAGITALQSATDAQVTAEREPASHAVDVVAAAHDGLQTSVDVAAGAFTVAADRYEDPDRPPRGHGGIPRHPRAAGRQGHRGRRLPPGPRQPADDPRLGASDPDQGRPRDDGGIGLSTGAAAGPRSAVAPSPDRVRRFEASAMASPLRLSVCRRGDEDRSREWETDAAWAAVRTEFETAEAELSRFRTTSDLTRLNIAAGTGQAGRCAATPRARAGGGRPGPPRHRRPLRPACASRSRPARLSGRDARGSDRRRERGPGRRHPRRRATGRARVAAASPIDLGGIGKGLTLRWAAALLDRRGVTGFLLEAGGDLVARGPGPDGDPWLVGIEDPAGGDRPARRDRGRGRRGGDVVGPAPVVGP